MTSPTLALLEGRPRVAECDSYPQPLARVQHLPTGLPSSLVIILRTIFLAARRQILPYLRMSLGKTELGTHTTGFQSLSDTGSAFLKCPGFTQYTQQHKGMMRAEIASLNKWLPFRSGKCEERAVLCCHQLHSPDSGCLAAKPWGVLAQNRLFSAVRWKLSLMYRIAPLFFSELKTKHQTADGALRLSWDHM